LERERDNAAGYKAAEKKLQGLWDQNGGDPCSLEETREKWERGVREEKESGRRTLPSSIYIGKHYSVFDKRERKNSTDEKEKGQAIQVQAIEKSKRLTATTTGSDDEDSDYKDDEEDDSDEFDPRKLGWDECARRGRLNATTTNSGRPNLRPKKQ
jgi:hypothetical protein